MISIKYRSGFTLIELLVVISIISLLSAVIFSGISSARVKARDLKRQTDIVTIMKGLEAYYSERGYYPQSGGANSPGSTWSNSNDYANTNGSWASLMNAIGLSMVTDPKQASSGYPGGSAGTHTYAYYSRGSGLCNNQWYMILYRPEGTVPVTSVTACGGSVFINTNSTYSGAIIRGARVREAY